jgi:hypothetical protein
MNFFHNTLDFGVDFGNYQLIFTPDRKDFSLIPEGNYRLKLYKAVPDKKVVVLMNVKLFFKPTEKRLNARIKELMN